MAKKRARGPAREVSRAELKAHERRASSISGPLVEAPAQRTMVDDAPAPTTTGPGTARGGVLPPRPSRVASAPTLTREQEMHYIRGDLRRLIVLSAGMIVLIIALTFVVPLLNF